MKRYAIVRVDNICPPIKMFCSDRKIDCKNCLHGDTKEQLIKKVLTAIHTLTSNLNRGDTTFISHETMARRIVEFLGVEDER